MWSRTKMKNLKNSDKIFEDMLEEDFIKTLWPNFCLQKFFGTLGVDIKYKFVTPPTTMYKTYSIIFWSLDLICIIYSVVYCSTQFDSLSTDIPFKMGIIINGIINTGLAWKSAFYSGQSKSQIYVKLQRIERILKMKEAKMLYVIRYIRSLIWIGFIVVMFSIWLIIFDKYIAKEFCPCEYMALVGTTASFYIILHICTLLIILTQRVEFVNTALMQVKDGSQKEVVYSTGTAKISDRISIDLVYGMRYILETFADIMDVFQHAVFFFAVEMLAWQLISMQNVVISIKKQLSVFNLPLILCTLPCSIIFMTIMVVLCFLCQRFVNMLETSEELCTAIISSLDGGESRRNAKRIRILVEGRRQATVFDVFTLNTRLPLQLLALTASYTIVLLQFASL